MGVAGRAPWGLGRGPRDRRRLDIDGSQGATESHRCEVRHLARLMASRAAARCHPACGSPGGEAGLPEIDPQGLGSGLHRGRGLALWGGRPGSLPALGFVACVLLGTEPLTEAGSPPLSCALPSSNMAAQAPAITPAFPANRKEERRKETPLSLRTCLRSCT